ncbi:uncharacterized protein LOC101853145 [Aplysia californica]|uniref:Uncharacterized protein LOC101853145 n=1 Tax=Aplysia californica TaxID=6500 RepID=A0ABM0JGZ3_APLCA|nr:uncharacterized protein LOC101853145 [Aplysia californica]
MCFPEGRLMASKTNFNGCRADRRKGKEANSNHVSVAQMIEGQSPVSSAAHENARYNRADVCECVARTIGCQKPSPRTVGGPGQILHGVCSRLSVQPLVSLCVLHVRHQNVYDLQTWPER